MIANMFEVIGDAITAFITALGNALNGVVSLFYVEATTGENATPGHFTILGILLLIGVGCGLVYFGFRLIRSLISRGR